MEMTRRDTVGIHERFLPPHERFRLNEIGQTHQRSATREKRDLGIPGGMNRELSHGKTTSPPIPTHPFPDSHHQNTQPIASPTDTVLEVWAAHYASGLWFLDDKAYALTVDGSGNVYVTGYSYNAETGNEYVTIKYDAMGGEEWVARYNGSGDGDDVAFALAVDENGNVYVTGGSYGVGTSSDYATIKYTASGVEEWVARYNGTGNNWDVPNALALDGSGNVYVTGGSYGPGTLSDYVTIKYDTGGAEEWVVRYNLGNGYDVANSIAVDGIGNVYVTGSSSGSAATIKYDSSGAEVWVTDIMTQGVSMTGEQSSRLMRLGVCMW